VSAIPLRQLEGKYEILEKVREGGMGTIYKVRHRLLDEVRVIKVMQPQLASDEDLRGRFLREARLATRFRHPNIALLHDFTLDEEDGTAFIVMEFITGMTLEDVLKGTGPPPLGLTLEIAQQSLRAIGYLHGKGLIHRDISPDNLMLTEDTDGQPLIKLIDLGIAKALAGGEGRATTTGTYLGKVRYSSPEQFGIESSARLDARGDLYSFEVVLYELLTGRYPIQGRDPSSLLAGHLFRSPLDFAETDPGGRVPAELREVVLSTLAKNADDRPRSAAALSQALGAFRTPDDFSREDLDRALMPSRWRARPLPAATLVTTTQGRLDEHFGPTVTPAPYQLAAVPKQEEPTRSRVDRGPGLPAAAEGTAAVSPISSRRWRRPLILAAGTASVLAVLLFLSTRPQPPEDAVAEVSAAGSRHEATEEQRPPEPIPFSSEPEVSPPHEPLAAELAAAPDEEDLERLRAARRAREAREKAAAALAAEQLDDQRLLSLLAEVDRQEQANRPQEGLELLAGATPNRRFEERFRQTRERLETQLAQLDRSPPAVTLAGAFAAEYAKGESIRVPLLITDDRGVATAELWARPEGGEYRKVAVRHLSGGQYEAEIDPAVHHNRAVEFYVTASDPTGNQGQLGSPADPQRLQRKRWFQKLVPGRDEG
jgi:serine/threonine protein kinase